MYSWNESCPTLFLFLLVMSFICLVGIIVYMYLGYVKFGSDTGWLGLSALGSATTILISLFLCWGIISLVEQSGLIGVQQCFQCMDSLGNNTACTTTSVCNTTSIKTIYNVSECTPALTKGIACEVYKLCVHSSPYTFWYSVVTAGLYVCILSFAAFVIFGRLIPSILVQAIRGQSATHPL
jgi:hypothetical protein